MAVMGSNASNTAMFGDQLFTDILAGNRLGVRTILLRPGLSNGRESGRDAQPTAKLMRPVEDLVIWRQKQLGLWPEEYRTGTANLYRAGTPDPQ